MLLDFDEPHRFVNSSAEAFAVGVAELRQALTTILGTDQPAIASGVYDRLTQRLRALDPATFAERENWWPLVLDDIRDTASVEWYAAFEYADAEGRKQIVTRSGAIAAHPEERLWSALHAAGAEPEQVLRIHTDLEACFVTPAGAAPGCA